MTNALDGKVFGRLTVIEKADKMGRRTAWKCLCSCGNEVTVRSFSLVGGGTQSCGCYALEVKKRNNLIHGMRKTRLYNTWANMVSRCKIGSSDSKYYAERGITLFEDWLTFAKFANWACNSGYDDSKEIDRINVKGNYCPSNCRWADVFTQAYNKGVYSSNTTGVTGVSFNKDMSKWHSRISYLGKEIHLGFFLEFEDAVKARHSAEMKYYGELKHPTLHTALQEPHAY